MKRRLASDPGELEATRWALLEAAREMDRAGLTQGTAGNLSARTRANEVVLTPTAMGYSAMKTHDLVVTDLEGRVLEGEREPTSEIHLHLACLRRHPEIAAVVHSHALHASMFAVIQQPIPCLVEELELYLGGDVEVAPYRSTGSKALGEVAAARLSDRAAVLLANHGLVTVGATPTEALQLTKLVERTARIVAGARQLGEPVPLPAEARSALASRYRATRLHSTQGGDDRDRD
jgi:L-fuculose-phosphate aldolase